MRTPRADVLWTLPFLAVTILSQTLPYNPTTILLPQRSSANKDIAYVFIKSTESQTQLLSLNISSPVSVANLSFQTVTADLPFLNQDSTAFIPSLSSAGEISVYTGDCSTSTSSELWRFTPSETSTTGEGSWEKQTTSTGSDATSWSMPGADFLSRGFSFSSLVNANASQMDIYIFGGMCPTSEATSSTWQSSSSYSNSMLRLSPFSNTEYSLSMPTSRGPPIAEAGFTITSLNPTYSNGSGFATQGQNFVLLGGHTQTAFINMSQVAIWSLPEESWSFVSMEPAAGNANTELAVKSTVPSVDSRSGHTAVLSEDGSSIIVFGGWVGDIGQAADPQLAVLSLGTGFGGDGEWTWSVPDQQPSGSGMYGHGAAMLPGNVMMVLGGYNISTPSNSKRDTIPGAQAMFFNATSMSWTSEYTNPAYVQAGVEKSTGSSSSSSTAKKLGLGAGLGLGLVAIIAAIVVLCWYNRRLKRRRDVRERDLNNLSSTTANYYSPRREMGERNGGFPWANNGWNASSSESSRPIYDSNSAVVGYENLQTGVHGLGDQSAYPQPPKQISRKPLRSRGARGLYQPTPPFDSHGRANSLGTAGPIHPIYEADEEDQVSRNSREGAGVGVGIALGEPGPSEPKRHSDPFRDPPILDTAGSLRRDHRNVATPDEESPARSREREIQEWVSDWAAADMLLNQQARSHSTQGRISPTRRAQLIQQAGSVSSVSGEEDGRTGSNLSEGSIAVSAMTISRSGSSSQSRSRNNSLRGFITNSMNPFAATMLTTSAPSTTLSPVFDTRPPPPRSAGSTSSSFTTAHTSFTALQVEAVGLLPGPDERASGENSPTRSEPETPGSPSKTKGVGFGKAKAQPGWLGSLRKVFVGESGSGNATPDFRLLPSRDTSPVRVDQTGTEPRRAVSAGATMWRRKQGKGDWEDSAENQTIGTRSNTFTGDLDYNFGGKGRDSPSKDDDDEDEWDIERAVQNRVVQVMFTVPKEKLRVVNHDVCDDISDVSSLRSRKGSEKSIRAVKTLDALVETEATDKQLETVVEKEKERPKSETDSIKSKGRGKSKVFEIVEMMEGRSSPKRS